jgi:hypothetical protein
VSVADLSEFGGDVPRRTPVDELREFAGNEVLWYVDRGALYGEGASINSSAAQNWGHLEDR